MPATDTCSSRHGMLCSTACARSACGSHWCTTPSASRCAISCRAPLRPSRTRSSARSSAKSLQHEPPSPVVLPHGQCRGGNARRLCQPKSPRRSTAASGRWKLRAASMGAPWHGQRSSRASITALNRRPVDPSSCERTSRSTPRDVGVAAGQRRLEDISGGLQRGNHARLDLQRRVPRVQKGGHVLGRQECRDARRKQRAPPALYRYVEQAVARRCDAVPQLAVKEAKATGEGKCHVECRLARSSRGGLCFRYAIVIVASSCCPAVAAHWARDGSGRRIVRITSAQPASAVQRAA
eukprot:scaffold18269_cov71-Phaeocystis_antarctica.AAC.14